MGERKYILLIRKGNLKKDFDYDKLMKEGIGLLGVDSYSFFMGEERGQLFYLVKEDELNDVTRLLFDGLLDRSTITIKKSKKENLPASLKAWKL